MHRSSIELFTLLLFLSFMPVAAEQPVKIAVLNLKNTEGVSQGEAELLTDRLRNDLFSTGRVEVMERDQMQTILAEQGFQQSGATCSDEGCMVEFGKLLGVKMLVSGSIGKLGKLFMINVKSIDVETAQITKVVSEDVRGDIEDVVFVLPLLAATLTGTATKTPPAAKPEEQPPPQPQAPKVETTDEPLPCDGSIYLEKIQLPRNIIKFAIEQDDIDNIDQNLAEALGKALDRSVITAAHGRISASTCKTLTIRVILNSYSVAPAAMKQFNGTLNASIVAFDSPKAKNPIITILFKVTGERHWGEITPLQYAFEALAETVEEDYYSQAKKALKEAGFKR